MFSGGMEVEHRLEWVEMTSLIVINAVLVSMK